MPRGDKKAYTSVIARIPQDLADQVKQYASVHRCSVSELIREGLEMRLEAEVPGRSTGHSGETGEEVLHEVLQTVKALAPMGQATLTDTLRQTITEVLHEVLPSYVSRQQRHREGLTAVVPGHTEVLPSETLTAPHGMNGITEVLPHQTLGHAPEQEGLTEVLPQQAAFDPAKFYLGKLCPQGHTYQGTAMSLLRRHNGHCRDCENQAKRAKRVQRRTAAAREG